MDVNAALVVVEFHKAIQWVAEEIKADEKYSESESKAIDRAAKLATICLGINIL